MVGFLARFVRLIQKSVNPPIPQSVKQNILHKRLELNTEMLERGLVLFKLGDEIRNVLRVERFAVRHLLLQSRLTHFGRGENHGFGARLLDAVEQHVLFRLAQIVLHRTVGGFSM